MTLTSSSAPTAETLHVSSHPVIMRGEERLVGGHHALVRRWLHAQGVDDAAVCDRLLKSAKSLEALARLDRDGIVAAVGDAASGDGTVETLVRCTRLLAEELGVEALTTPSEARDAVTPEATRAAKIAKAAAASAATATVAATAFPQEQPPARVGGRRGRRARPGRSDGKESVV